MIRALVSGKLHDAPQGPQGNATATSNSHLGLARFLRFYANMFRVLVSQWTR